MSKPLVAYPDAEKVIVDWLTDDLDDEGVTCTVGTFVPESWVRTDTTFVQVACDSQTLDHPVVMRCLMRISVWAHGPTEAKRVASIAQAILLTSDICGCLPESGPTSGIDPENGADFATFTVTAAIRSDTSIVT